MPTNTWVADFLGLDNLVPAEVASETSIVTGFGEVVLKRSLPPAGTKGHLLVYPAAIQIFGAVDNPANGFMGLIQRTSFHGHTHTILLTIGDVMLQTLIVGECSCKTGDLVKVWLDPAHLGWINNENE
jgi:ABC-type Fe3+/spermidine/putrescine transport system ATPase subunit